MNTRNLVLLILGMVFAVASQPLMCEEPPLVRLNPLKVKTLDIRAPRLLQDEMSWCNYDHPARQVCGLNYFENRALDCDDAALLVCLQFPEGQCWISGFSSGPECSLEDPTGLSHAISVIRHPTPNPDGTWRFCAVEPTGLTPIYCWDSPDPNAVNSYPVDELRRAICQFYGPGTMRPWFDCSQCDEPIFIDPPHPGHSVDINFCGEPGIWKCGSYIDIDLFCQGYGRDPSINCLPEDVRGRVQPCSIYDAPIDYLPTSEDRFPFPSDNWGPYDSLLCSDRLAPRSCQPGEITLCTDGGGGLHTRFCCASQNPYIELGFWCLVPYRDTDLPACSSLVGQTCNRDNNHRQDCWDTEQPRTPGGRYDIRTLSCRNCPTNYKKDAAIMGNNAQCWIYDDHLTP